MPLRYHLGGTWEGVEVGPGLLKPHCPAESMAYFKQLGSKIVENIESAYLLYWMSA